MAKSAKGAGSIRQRPNGLWEARYTVGKNPATGKPIRKSIYGKTQQEVRKKLASVTVSIDEGIYTEPARITFGQWLTIWLEEYCGAVKPRTLELYGNTIEYRILPILGRIRLLELSPVILQDFYNNSIQGKYGENRAISPKTLHNIHGIIHKALKQAVSIGYIKSNPAGACVLPKVQRKELHPLDEKQTKAFVQAIENDPFQRLFLVALFTGMREGELLGLCKDKLNLKNGSLVVCQQLQLHKGAYVLMPPKNGKSRTVPLAPFVVDILKSQLKEQAENRLKAGPLWEDSGFVFTNEIGQHIKRQTLYRHFKKAVEAIGAPSVRFHDLRHSYAVAALRAGDDVKSVSENLGHASVAFTLDVYGHVTEDMRKSSAAKMQEYINSLQG